MEDLEDHTGGEAEFKVEEGCIVTKEGSTPPMTSSQVQEATLGLRDCFSEFGEGGNANKNLEEYSAAWAANDKEREWNRRNHFYLVLSDPAGQIVVIQHEPTERQARLIKVLTVPVTMQLAEEEI